MVWIFWMSIVVFTFYLLFYGINRYVAYKQNFTFTFDSM